MKQLFIVAAVSATLLSGVAYAGGCDYGNHASAQSEKLPMMAVAGETEEEFLARLKKLQEEPTQFQSPLDVPITYN